jgi:hypothetical protein
MSAFRAGRLGLIVALGAALSCTVAFADEPAVRDETNVHVRTSAGAIEQVRFEGELAVGETRALVTELGNPATLVRGETGLTLTLAGEQFELPVAAGGELDPDTLNLVGAGAGETGDGKRIVMIKNHHDHALETDIDVELETGETPHQRRIVKVIRHGDHPEGSGPEAMEFSVDSPEELLSQGNGPRVIVTRKLVRAHTPPAG